MFGECNIIRSHLMNTISIFLNRSTKELNYKNVHNVGKKKKGNILVYQNRNYVMEIVSIYFSKF